MEASAATENRAIAARSAVAFRAAGEESMKTYRFVAVAALVAVAACASPLSCMEREHGSNPFVPLIGLAVSTSMGPVIQLGSIIDIIISMTEIGWHEGTHVTDPRINTDDIAASQPAAKRNSRQPDLWWRNRIFEVTVR
jgi:hypothetical protein